MKRLSQGKLNKKYYEEFVDRSKWEKELWQKRRNRVMEVQEKTNSFDDGRKIT